MPETVRMLDFGGISFFAPQTFLDNHNRRIMFGWIAEGRSNAAQLEAGWSGVMSLPRLLSLHPTGVLGVAPAPELQVLRGKHNRFEDIELTPASPPVLNDIRGDSFEIMAEFEPGEAARFGLKVRCSPDGEEETLIIYDQGSGYLAVDRQKSSLSLDVDREMNEGLFELADGETLKLHIFLDRSVIEIFANGRACLTSRVYPTRADSLGIGLFAQRGNAKLKSLDIWKIRSIFLSLLFSNRPS